MELRMLRKHQFPAPFPSASNIPTPSVPVSSVPPVIETFPELLTPETDQIYLEAADGKMDSTIRDSAEDINFNLNCVDQMDFESHVPGNVALTPFNAAAHSRSSTHVRMSDPPRPRPALPRPAPPRPAPPLFSDFQESFLLFSLLGPDHPTLQDLVGPPEGAHGDQGTSTEVRRGQRDLICRP